MILGGTKKNTNWSKFTRTVNISQHFVYLATYQQEIKINVINNKEVHGA